MLYDSDQLFDKPIYKTSHFSWNYCKRYIIDWNYCVVNNYYENNAEKI